jgi:hypothetical protein
MTTISTIIQQTNLDQVGSVVVTEITQDQTTNEYMRQIRVYAPPDVNGNTALVFTLQVAAVAQSGVELVAPSALF